MDTTDSIVTINVPNEPPLVADMSEVFRLEARKQEVAVVTKATAASLLRAMEDGYAKSGGLLATVTYREAEVELAIKRRRSYLTIEIVPATLQTKGLATARSPTGSEDLRESVMSLDVELQQLENALVKIRLLKDNLKNKVQGFQMSFTATKKVVDQSGMDFAPTFSPGQSTPKY